MDAKDLRIESAPTTSDQNNDGSKYVQNGSVLQCNRNKSYQDIGSNSLAKVDVPTARPCAVIGPDRVIPPAVTNEAYLKKAPVEPWPFSEHTYRRPPEYPHRIYQNPTRNISPRQTFQENMPRIMVPPTFSSVKVNDDPNFTLIPDRNVPQSKNTKLNLPTEAKYCDVPYNVNPLTNDQKNNRNADISVSSVNPSITRTTPHGWPPGSVNLRPTRVYGAPELYQYPEYPSCAGPRSVPISRPHRTVQEDPTNYVYSDPYYHETNIRFKPYPIPKDIQRYPQPRYEYIGNYSNPFHPPPPFPYKYELQKPMHPHPYQAYPHLKYLEGRIPDPLMEGYQRSPSQQANYNIAYRNQIIHPPYGPLLSNAPQNKMQPYPTDSSIKSIPSNKLPYENNNKMYLEHENARNKAYPSISDNCYLNDMSRVHPIRSQVIMANYPSVNMHPIHPYYKKENSSLKNYDYMSHYKGMDSSMTINNSLLRHPSRFSPSSIAISPSDSNTSIDTLQTQGTLQEDCGYVSQSSTASVRSIDTGINRIPNDYYKKYDYRYGPVIRHPISKPELNHNSNIGSKSKKGIDVRQFFQMWNEGEDENNENSKEIAHVGSNDKNNTPKQHETTSQEQLYVLGLVNVPSEELGKYEHIQQVSKLPENIKGYSSIELLNQFEDAIESSNISCHKPPTPREFSMLGTGTIMKQSADIMHRPLSPLDVEAKISQSIIHKEVGCNFEIKPCSPKMLNVEIAAPVHNILGERLIEKVANPLMIRSPILTGDKNIHSYAMKRQDHRLNLNDKVPSCKMVNTQFSTDHSINSMKTNYSLHDLESNSGVCLASLPRLDNDIELSFPEVNQQFINANKGESTGSLNELPDLESSTVELGKTNSTDKGVLQECDTVQQFSSLHETEKEFIKLSKYRKSKSSTTDFKEEDLQMTSKVVRTDSVIIKNPDNIKSYEDSIGFTMINNVPFENQQTAINLSSNCNIVNRVDEKKLKFTAMDNTNSHNNMPNDVAIDFSINKQANNFLNSYIEIKKNKESVEQKKYMESKICEEFQNEMTKPNENFDEELKKSSNTIDDIIACQENVIQTETYTNIVNNGKHLGENNKDIVHLITNSEKCGFVVSTSSIKTLDNGETDNDNLNFKISKNSPIKLPYTAKTNSDDLFQNNNDVKCSSTTAESDAIQNNLPEVFTENEIDKEIKDKNDDSSLSLSQNMIEKNLFHMTADGFFKTNDDQERTNDSKMVESDVTQNNLSEVLAEGKIDETITSNKEDSLHSETHEVTQNNLFHTNDENLSLESINSQEYTTDSKITESDAIQNNLSDILAENECDQTITINKNENEIELTLISNKEDSLLFENQGVNENTDHCKKISVGDDSLNKTKTVNAFTFENDLNSDFINENHKFCSNVQTNLLDVDLESKNYTKDESKPYIETKTSLHSQKIMPVELISSKFSCSDETENSLTPIGTLSVSNEATCSPKPMETVSVSDQDLSWNKQSNTTGIRDIENTSYMHDNTTCEDRNEVRLKCNILSGPYNSNTKLFESSKTKAKSVVYVKCSKALYSPWIQKLLLYHEGRYCDKLNNASNFEMEDILQKPCLTFFNSDSNIDALNDTKLKELLSNTDLQSTNSCPIRNVECLIKDATIPNITDVVFNDSNDYGLLKNKAPEKSDLSQSDFNQIYELESEKAKSGIEFHTEKDNFLNKLNCDDIKIYKNNTNIANNDMNTNSFSESESQSLFDTIQNKLNCDDIKLNTDNASIGNDDINKNCLNDNISASESESLFETIRKECDVNDTIPHINEDGAIEDITEVHNDTTDLTDEKFSLANKKETPEFLSKNRLSLKRSLSDSAINVYKNDCSQDSDNNLLKWPFKRKKMCNVDDRVEANLIAENVCKILQNNRRNSISSSIYNEENVSICIFIDNNCIITEENDVEEKNCYTELPNDCLPECSDSVNEEQNTDYSTEDTSCFEEKICEFIPFNQCPILQCSEGGKDIEESWVDDVACVETVVSDDISEDVEISDPSTTKDTDTSDNDESGFFSNNISDHTDKVKYIYGDKMCSDDAELVEKLYRTPQMNVNKTLINKDFHANEEYTNYYDKESLEKILSDSNSQQGSPCTSVHTDSNFLFDNPIKTPDDKENVDVGNLSPTLNKYNYERDNDIESEMKDINNVYSNVIHEKMLEVTVNSCESSIDNVFTYKQKDETNSLTSSSPEVSSTTSEEKNSSILLKITNYKGSIISQINDAKSDNIKKTNFKFKEQHDFVNSCPNLPTNRPLITKAAQKYIPPLKESLRDLKVKLSLPQHSLIKLKQMKISKDEPKLNKHIISVPKTSKKPKPKFEDVLKSIDEIQFKMHKERSKKVKKSIPKVVIKKTQNGSHYASTSNKDVFNPDLTGRKWQPWVFLEKNTFIDKMATKKNTRAIFSHRKNTYVLAENFRKYKSVSSNKFVISQPKFDDSSSGHLKYTIRLKQSY